MSKMREAFERWFSASKYAQVILPAEEHKQIAWDGYQAAIAAIREGGAHSWYLENEDEYMSEFLRKEHERLDSYTFKLCKVAIPLYRIPEDLP